MCTVHNDSHKTRVPRSGLTHWRGFALPELLVVLGVSTLLFSLVLAGANKVREAAARTQCASNLRQLGMALEAYALDNRGWLPRDCTVGYADRPAWLYLVAAALRVKPLPTNETELTRISVLQCPSHPLKDIPSGFVINAFALERQPRWSPDGPIKANRMKRTSELPWLLEAADRFNDFIGPSRVDAIYFVQFHDVWHPNQLPDGTKHRISDSRHGDGANVLYRDGHVSVVFTGTLKLSDFDDLVRDRATEGVFQLPPQ